MKKIKKFISGKSAITEHFLEKFIVLENDFTIIHSIHVKYWLSEKHWQIMWKIWTFQNIVPTFNPPILGEKNRDRVYYKTVCDSCYMVLIQSRLILVGLIRKCSWERTPETDLEE